MNILLFDTETTGVVDFKKPVDDKCQPRLVQLAAMLVVEGKEIASLNCIVKPIGFSIPSQASAVHGITTEFADKNGVLLDHTLNLFYNMLCNAELVVGHNVPFDMVVVGSEFMRKGLPDFFLDKKSYCTMKESTDIVKIRSAWGYKWPKLAEAYQFAFKEPLANAHDAMIDLRATFRLYNWLKGLKKPVEEVLADVV